MMNRVADIIVIGGGLHGLSAALQSARRGARVIVLEGEWIGRHASSATAAGVRTLNRDWREVPLSLFSMQMWHELPALVGDDCGFHADGQVNIAESEEALATLRQRAEACAARGYSHERLIDREELRALVPSIGPQCAGALYAPDNGAADPHRMIRAFRRACEAAGVSLYEGRQVTELRRKAGSWQVQAGDTQFSAPVVINAAGAWAASVAALAGETIPLGHKASMMIVTERLAPFLRQVISAVGRNLTFKQTAQGSLLIGGGLQGRADVAAKRSWVCFHTLSRSAQSVVHLFPQLGEVNIVRCWTGIEAKTEDLLPVIDRSHCEEGLWHAFGFSGHGFQLVPGVGSVLADLATTGKTAHDISAFSSRRLTHS